MNFIERLKKCFRIKASHIKIYSYSIISLLYVFVIFYPSIKNFVDIINSENQWKPLVINFVNKERDKGVTAFVYIKNIDIERLNCSVAISFLLNLNKMDSDFGKKMRTCLSNSVDFNLSVNLSNRDFIWLAPVLTFEESKNFVIPSSSLINPYTIDDNVFKSNPIHLSIPILGEQKAFPFDQYWLNMDIDMTLQIFEENILLEHGPTLNIRNICFISDRNFKTSSFTFKKVTKLNILQKEYEILVFLRNKTKIFHITTILLLSGLLTLFISILILRDIKYQSLSMSEITAIILAPIFSFLPLRMIIIPSDIKLMTLCEALILIFISLLLSATCVRISQELILSKDIKLKPKNK